MKPSWAKIEVGTVIHGTHRGDDLLRAFTHELARVSDPHANSELLVEAMSWIGRDVDSEDDVEAQHDVLMALMDALDDLAPPGLCFGAHEGDGADFGWWPVGDEEPDGSDPDPAEAEAAAAEAPFVVPPPVGITVQTPLVSPTYQVIVDYYNAPAWYGPQENDGDAHRRYGEECARLHQGGIRKVVLCKHGIVIAVANHEREIG